MPPCTASVPQAAVPSMVKLKRFLCRDPTGLNPDIYLPFRQPLA